MEDSIIDAIGFVAGVLGVIAWWPQLIRVWSEKRHDGISVPTFLIICLSISLWLTFGVLTESLPIIAANIVTLVVLLILVFGVIRLRKNERQEYAEAHPKPHKF
ncbi:MAG: SemiSWEET family transporter [archaeon]|nr:SemiSWEET family transporter [archaeon]MDA1167476.1 SemiSWEET family transporter [archaeon]